MSKIINFLREDEGVTAIEYGLIAALIVVGLVTALTTIGTNLKTQFSKVASSIPAT